MAVKAWTPTHADRWEQPVNKMSPVAFSIVMQIQHFERPELPQTATSIRNATAVNFDKGR